jgi:hypothetical protein
LGYEPNELPTAPPRDIFLRTSFLTNHLFSGFDPEYQNF